eukprot:scaffold3852_cov402-Prasinococcus_capsulatus_cf.AAC.2
MVSVGLCALRLATSSSRPMRDVDGLSGPFHDGCKRSPVQRTHVGGHVVSATAAPVRLHPDPASPLSLRAATFLVRCAAPGRTSRDAGTWRLPFRPANQCEAPGALKPASKMMG